MKDNKPTILVADDDALIRESAVRALTNAGYTVVQAADGEEALAQVRAQQPDLVLLDVNMPGLNGFEVLTRMKADPQLATSFVVIISGSRIDTESQIRGLETGADDYLTRPIGNRELVARVQAILRIKQAEEKLRQSEERFRQHNETLALLYQAGQTLSQSLDPQTIYQRLYGWVSASIPCDAFFVASYDHDQELIHCVYATIEGQNIPADQLPPIPLEPEGMGTQSIVIRSGKPLLISNYQEYMARTITHYDVNKKGKVQEQEQADTNSALLVPMILAGRVMGVIQLMSNQKDAFSAEQLQLLESLAAYAVVAQNNALLYEKANREIAERKRAEAAVRTLNAELEQRVAERTRELNAINQELEAFSYSVSHDLRAPLRAIDGWGQALVEDYGDLLGEEGRALLQRQRAASRRMGLLIDDLLQLSRLTRRPLNRQQVDLAELVVKCWQELESQHQPINARLIMGELPPCQADPSLLQQVLTNLLSNGLKYSSRQIEPRLEIGSQAAGDHELVYFVRDNGVGFDPNYHDKLFNPFQRLHSQHEFSGTGIGLAIVQRVIHRHGGRVWAESKPGQGATFYFSLPD
jgi:signal transduction histidine kinase/CheY-like chemotaxis protein